jgi:hypothetical protein
MPSSLREIGGCSSTLLLYNEPSGTRSVEAATCRHDELQLLCLSMLNAMLPASLEAYHASRMNSQLLALLNWYYCELVCMSKGVVNSF